MIIKALASIGLLLSSYALYVRYQASSSEDYRALCDLGDNVSCSRAFSSRYGKIAVLPNPVYGLIFYSLVLALDLIFPAYVRYMAFFSVVGSIYLAYLSYFRQKNFCVVCTSIYIVNTLLLVFSI